MIDLSKLPAPNVIEALSYEQIYAERKQALIAKWPLGEHSEIAELLEIESEPLTKLLQENAYRELILRQRINDAAKSVFAAYAKGSDLDSLLDLLGVELQEGESDKEPLEFLDATDYLDGRYTISGETLDGFGVLGGGDLRYPTLADHEDTLDDTRLQSECKRVADTTVVSGVELLATATLKGIGAGSHTLREVGAFTADGTLVGRRVISPKQFEPETKMDFELTFQYHCLPYEIWPTPAKRILWRPFFATLWPYRYVFG